MKLVCRHIHAFIEIVGHDAVPQITKQSIIEETHSARKMFSSVTRDKATSIGNLGSAMWRLNQIKRMSELQGSDSDSSYEDLEEEDAEYLSKAKRMAKELGQTKKKAKKERIPITRTKNYR